MSHEEAAKIISAGKGNHFDPDLVDAFLELQEAFQGIAARYADHPEPVALETGEA
ncbi:hypothetical protein D3C78_1583150 [compost metagenome]